MTTTQIKFLKPGDEALLEAFLLPRLDSSMFLLGNMRHAGLEDNGERYAGTYAAIIDDEQITGVVAHFGQGNLICQAPLDDAGPLAQAAIEKSGRAVHGVVGPADQVEKIREQLAIDDSYVQLDATEQLYNLSLAELIVPKSLQTGELVGRRIEQRDLDQLAEWRVAYSMEGLGSVDTPELRKSSRAGIERSLADGTGWIVEVDGKNVACSYFNASVAEAVQIGGVWTPPELRGRGYARAAVATSLIDARKDGVTKAILFTDDNNIPAQKAYQALGFRHIGDYRLFILHTPFVPKKV